MATAVITTKAKERRSGLSYWMDRVLRETERVATQFDVDSVHDLRVALRRCRTMADALAEIDPDPFWRAPSWKAMKRAGRKLFRRLGDLRNVHVMVALVKGLAPEADPIRGRILETLADEEERCRVTAASALSGFDARKWKSWRGTLRQRASLVRPDGLVAQALALERLIDARTLHDHARHHRSAAAFHELRVGIKRFRYVVENFLPHRHEDWGQDLKRLQDLLGDVHDLDELWKYVMKLQPPLSAEERSRWSQAIKTARSEKLDEYRMRIVEKNKNAPISLWNVWARGLPQQARVQSAALARLRATARALDPDFLESRRLGEFALELFDALRSANISPVFNFPDSRRLFRAAATLRGVGKNMGPKANHKAARKIIRKLVPPPGWTANEMTRLGAIVRYQRGAEPLETRGYFESIDPAERDQILWLAGTLRLALALGTGGPAEISVAGVEKTTETAAIVIRVRGYVESPKSAARLVARKHMLESMVRRPILIEHDTLSGLRNGLTEQS
ncbi:MAG TPA: CHAD domain-containing protein [Candidatus Dormibacteraeota bacterium]|nr:CHAD domain-containing protein [Candidatus Dormibacteraeota bacterium]